MKDMSMLADCQQQSGVVLLTNRADPFDEVQRIGPGEVPRYRMPEERFERAPIPIENSVTCRHTNPPVLSRVRDNAAAINPHGPSSTCSCCRNAAGGYIGRGKRSG
jgi:hypothetical protein